MEQDQLEIDVAQDGQPINDHLIKHYNLQKNDIFYSSYGDAYINFVGVVQHGTRILISMPKHFKTISEFEAFDINTKKKYIRLIIDSINTSVRGSQNTTSDVNFNFPHDFALDAYFKIYAYFAQYGLYHEEYEEVCPKKGNKISWKETLSKSNKFITKGNLLFSPLFYKKKRGNETLVTECMIFVLNYTQLIFGDFMTLPNTSRITNRGINLSILGNEAVIYKLEEILCTTFKDINKQLIGNIINFLKRVDATKEKVPDIKYYNYENVWEKAVEKYINDRFEKIEKNNMVFSDHQLSINRRFNKEIISSYNLVKKHNNWRIEPDHYYKDRENKTIYIFDSKYYTKLNELNHKQFVYHTLLSNKNPNYKIFDGLIIPTAGSTQTEPYLDVAGAYLSEKGNPFKIYLTKLNMIDVLKNYIS